ncbi:hypothetical protein PGTUg99_032698 [Puccinia graminis f. sp. tritici]|uniref:Uncharacterized protein n=1 Tax=Puccinia graminis f. sp. tritici TaxID=56615 RepID=A0A5B0RFC1_PUCGR|nr:hypothetical protein PGTUg99_032698 [Puccinia graminis f. sp. tritici]
MDKSSSRGVGGGRLVTRFNGFKGIRPAAHRRRHKPGFSLGTVVPLALIITACVILGFGTSQCPSATPANADPGRSWGFPLLDVTTHYVCFRLQVQLTSQRPSWTRATPAMMCVACTDPDGGNLGLTQGTEHVGTMRLE